MRRTAGILGGMGPQATVDLMQHVIRLTPAEKEGDHVRMLVDCNPAVPDRVAAILEGGDSPAPVLAEMARRLVAAGADLLAIPCNTAHHFLDAVRGAVEVPVLDMIELTVAELREAPAAPRLGLLATSGTLRTRLYHEYLEPAGVEVLVPDDDDQRVLMGIIRKVKVNAVTPADRETMRRLVGDLEARGATAFIAGCTEVPLALPESALPLPVVDPVEILARTIVRLCTEGQHA